MRIGYQTESKGVGINWALRLACCDNRVAADHSHCCRSQGSAAIHNQYQPFVQGYQMGKFAD